VFYKLLTAHKISKGQAAIVNSFFFPKSNMRKGVSSGRPNSKKWVEKNKVQSSFFNRLRGIWIPDETLFQVFEIASQTIDNSWRNSKERCAKF